MDSTQGSDPTPAELVARIRAGDRAAETILVEKYQRPLLEILRHRTADPELAQDLLQDTLTIIIQRLRGEGLEDPEKLVAFMHRTARNLVIAHFRKESRRNTQLDTETVEIQRDPRAGQLETLLAEERGRMVRKLLDELPTPRDREVLLRFYVRGHEKAQVCQLLGLNSGQFDRVISRARKRFRELVETALGENL
jgi:RNA polymerase sigma-70 factor (ECF subfamily)